MHAHWSQLAQMLCCHRPPLRVFNPRRRCFCTPNTQPYDRDGSASHHFIPLQCTGLNRLYLSVQFSSASSHDRIYCLFHERNIYAFFGFVVKFIGIDHELDAISQKGEVASHASRTLASGSHAD